MARTDLAVTEITTLGVDSAATLAAANVDGHAVINNGATWLEVLNTNAVTVTVTVQTPRTVDRLAVAELTFTVAQNERKHIAPFPRDTYNIKSGADAGKMYVDFSGVTALTIAAWRLAQ